MARMQEMTRRLRVRKRQLVAPEDPRAGGVHAGDDEEAESEEEAELVAPEDPRAGGVHAVIPQLAVDYQCLSVRMFEAGSEEGLKNSNRQALYELSKMFKDVAQDVFPLGPNIEDDEQIPKIKEKKGNPEIDEGNREGQGIESERE